MIDELQIRINKQNKQKFMAHPFNLCNLLEGFSVPPIFTVAVSQIFSPENQSQNMTFGVQKYGIKILKSKDNILRILYYSLLCYIFELKQHFLTVAMKNKFVTYVLNSLKTILPAKYQNDHYLRISKKPFLTTSQIKSAFVKFMRILQKKPKECKMIIQELSSLPQMDFIFMSIFKSLINYKIDKNGCIVLPEDQLAGLQQKIGFNFRTKNDQIIIQNQFHIKLIDKSLQIEQFIIEKYVQPKTDSVIKSKLIRKDTTQSVGEIDQDEYRKNTQSIPDRPDPFNAKLVVSQSTDQFDQQMMELNELKEYINTNNTFDDQTNQKLESQKQKSHTSKFNPFSKKQNNQQFKNEGIQRNSIVRKTLKLNNLNLKPRLSQIVREKTTSKSKTKMEQDQINSRPSNFRSFWKIKSKLKTQQSQQSKKYQNTNLKRQKTFGDDQFCLQRTHTFGNEKVITLYNNLSKQNIPNSNSYRNIFNQISEHVSSPKSQHCKIQNKKQSHSSFCSKLNFNNANTTIQTIRQQKSLRYNGSDQNRKYSFQMSINGQNKKNYQRISGFARAK